MSEVKAGSTVTIDYIGTLENGRIFHRTEESGPLRLVVGAGEVFAALDSAEVTLDANHPLAGCELTFALKVVEVT